MLSRSNILIQVTEAQLRDGILAALGELRRQAPARSLFKYSDVVGRCLRIALPSVPGHELTSLARRIADLQADLPESPSGPPDEHPDNQALLAVVWRLVAEGVVYPRLREHRSGFVASIEYLTLTSRGVRVVAGDGDHPLRPGFVARMRLRAPTLSGDVAERLADAVSCLEHGLLRAAVVMVGLAVEETLLAAHDALAARGTMPTSRARNARDRLGELHAWLAGWANADERHRLQIALVAAENVRSERNRASHPGERFEDTAAVEELLVSASRQLPVIWSVLLP